MKEFRCVNCGIEVEAKGVRVLLADGRDLCFRCWSDEVTDWPGLRRTLLLRDGPCISNRVDVFGFDGLAQDLCQGPSEFDHVTQVHGHLDGRRDDEAHGVMVCAWHHRLAVEWRSDSSEHRAAERAYLTRMYPECLP